MPEMTGRCQCGQVRYAARGAPLWTALCHCESCRRAASAPLVAWMGFAPQSVSWHGQRKFYRSSSIATRGFCPDCGSQMSFESTRWPGEIHLYAASLDAPEAYRPQLHCHQSEQLSWLQLSDDLPIFAASAAPA